MYDDDLFFSSAGGGTISLTVEGHALPDRNQPVSEVDATTGAVKGENIVCAAVSFSAQTLVRSMTIIAGIRPDYTIENGYMDVTIRINELNEEKTKILKVLLESFMIGMLDLREKHPDIITMRTVQETTER
ncbi:MAG: hypothetical protein A2176_01085 [Spirochaetes bacterium RBG_13_51_14]|nr:MAG: hypothetical protein A2176_01085 [Spirochaetes bacterium RBG_13_51_14]